MKFQTYTVRDTVTLNLLAEDGTRARKPWGDRAEIAGIELTGDNAAAVLGLYVRVGATLDAGDDVHEAVADLVRAAALDIAGSIEPLENMHTAARKEKGTQLDLTDSTKALETVLASLPEPSQGHTAQSNCVLGLYKMSVWLRVKGTPAILGIKVRQVAR